MKHLRGRLTYANLLSTLCLFLLLGGGAFAAIKLPKNSVGPRQLKKNAVTGAKVKNQSLTGRDVVASSLGTVPSAANASHADRAGDSATLQGNGPDAFVHGDGSVIVARRDMDVGADSVPLLDIPGVATLTAQCRAGPTEAGFQVENTSGATLDAWRSFNGAAPEEFAFAPAGKMGTLAISPTVMALEAATRIAGGKCQLIAAGLADDTRLILGIRQ